MGESSRGGPDGDRTESRTDGADAKSRRPKTESQPNRSRWPDGSRLARLGDRLGVDALGWLSWRRRWVGGTRPWRVSAAAFPREGSPTEKAQFLAQYAVLAPSSHNTQPWLFNVADGEIRLFADLHRWLRVADPRKRELYVSLGAALENLLLAADHFGVDHEVRYLPGSDATHVATVRLSGNDDESEETSENDGSDGSDERDGSDGSDAPLEDSRRSGGRDSLRPEESEGSRLFEAIPRRRTDRREYQRRPIPREDLRALREIVTEDDVALQFVVEPDELNEIATLAARADRRLFADPAYREELARWLNRGAFGHSWPKAKIGGFAVRHLNVGRLRARSDAKLLRAAPVVGVVRTRSDVGTVEARDDRATQIRAGQAFQRASLLATALDVRTHSMSALLEVPALRRELTDLLGRPDWTPQHLFRLGYAEGISAPSPRRSVNAVLVD